MAIKSRTTDLGEAGTLTEYLYAECEVESGTVNGLRWETDPDLHRKCVRASGASNERQLLEVDDLIDDDVRAEWLQVDATSTGNTDSNGDPIYVYDVSRDDTARDNDYAAELKIERDALLGECDWYAMRHRDQADNSETTSLSGAEYTELLNYRKALRDWPSDEVDIYDRTAPTKPAWM